MLNYFLLLGQSNMAGRGSLTAHDREAVSSDGVYVFDPDACRWLQASDPLQRSDDPVFSVRADRIGGIGPGMSFAKAMRDALCRDTGLLLCAKGGDGIEAWDINGTLYQEAVRRAQIASLSASLKGVCLYVGEGDTSSEHTASLWPMRFHALCSQLRKDLGGDLPIVFAQIAMVSDARRARREHGYAGWDALKAHQAATSIERGMMIKTDDLPLNDDGLHLSTSAQRALGIRFANAMRRLLECN